MKTLQVAELDVAHLDRALVSAEDRAEEDAALLFTGIVFLLPRHRAHLQMMMHEALERLRVSYQTRMALRRPVNGSR